MTEKYEPFKEYVEKEKNRVELNRAIEATPIRDQWRQIIVVILAVLILGGMFISRTKRFKSVLEKIESSEMGANLRIDQEPKKKLKAAGAAVTLERARAQWARENDSAAAEEIDGDLAQHRKAREKFGAALEGISNNAHPSVQDAEGRELIGIGHKTPEPELDAFQLKDPPSKPSQVQKESAAD